MADRNNKKKKISKQKTLKEKDSTDGNISTQKTRTFEELKKGSKLFRTASFGKNLKRGADRMKSQIARKPAQMLRIMKKQFKRKEETTDNNDAIGKLDVLNTKPPLYPQMRDGWLTVQAKSIAKDIHRLIYRITVRTSGINSVLLSPPPVEERRGVLNAALAVIGLIKLLGKRLLEEEEFNNLCEMCDKKVERVNDRTDLLIFHRELLEEMGEENKITKILRCIHQSMVLKPYGILRTVMIKDKITKDVRGDEGWQIEIIVANEGFIQVTHRRREQSIDFPTKAQPDKLQNHWEYKWEVSMTFDKEMKDMTQSRLSITDLVLSDGMDPELEKELKHILQDGNLIVF